MQILCGVDGDVVGRRHVKQQPAPFGLLFVANREENLGQHMIDPLDAAVGARVVSAGVGLADANAVVDDGRQVEDDLSTLSEGNVTGNPQRRVYSLCKMSAVPAAVNFAAETTNISIRRLKRSVNSRMCTFPRGVKGRGPK